MTYENVIFKLIVIMEAIILVEFLPIAPAMHPVVRETQGLLLFLIPSSPIVRTKMVLSMFGSRPYLPSTPVLNL